jgi:hypothetical protein
MMVFMSGRPGTGRCWIPLSCLGLLLVASESPDARSAVAC